MFSRIVPRRPQLLRSERGNSTAEFALVLPVLILLIFGAIGICTMMYANSILHFTTQDAARCASVKTATCTNSTSTTNYITGKYSLTGLTSANYTLDSSQACGNQVTGTANFLLSTGLWSHSYTLRAVACYPIASQ